MSLRFGTDGVRGAAFTELTRVFARDLGRATVPHLGTGPYLIARDTRESGPAIEAALADGLVAAGARVVSLGVLPTPGLAANAQAAGLPAAMISASHNPYADNGIKLFAAGGRKLDDATQAAVQSTLEGLVPIDGEPSSTPLPVEDRSMVYCDAVVASLGGRRLDGLRLVIDCANGAASAIAPEVLRRLGAKVDVLAAAPDGRNINDRCGSTYPEALQAAVLASGADAGLAFDGDADRVLAVDGAGALVDGDRIIAICALDRDARGLLVGRTVVVTVMSNLGFRLAMTAAGLTVVETAVGDRYVLEALEANGWVLGGEQSGHVIFRDLATTGDGLMTGVQLLDTVVRSGRTLADLSAQAMDSFPQVLRNVRIHGDRDVVVAAMRAAAPAIEARLGDRGRVLIRPSGTEPLIRVMAEAETEQLAAAVVDELCAIADG